MIETDEGTTVAECEQCGAAMPEGQRQCAKCHMISARQELSALNDETHRLLAEANLFRLRGQFDEAITMCTRIIRLDAANAAAHSLLGDIYQEQGNYREALGWYKLSVRLDETNAADRRKLDEMIDRVFQSAQFEQTLEPSPSAASAFRKGATATSRSRLGDGLAKLKPVHIVVASTLLFMGIAIVVMLQLLPTKPAAQAPTADKIPPQVSTTPPDAEPQPSTTAPLETNAGPQVIAPTPDVVEVGPNPNALHIVTTPSTTTPSATTSVPRAAPQLTEESPTVRQVPPFQPSTSAQGTMTLEEAQRQAEVLRTALEKAIRGSKAAFATIDSVAIDPRTNTASVQYTVPAMEDAAKVKKVLLYVGFKLVWAGYSENKTLKLFSLRGCAPREPGSAASLALFADVTPVQAVAATEAADYSAVAQQLTNPVWRDDLAQAAL